MVSRLCKQCKRAGLLHDAHEALIGDLPGPVKHAFEVMFPETWSVFEGMVAAKVRARFGVPKRIPEMVHEADMFMRQVEVYHCSRNGSQYMKLGLTPDSGYGRMQWDGIWDATRAKREFLTEAKLLGVY